MVIVCHELRIMIDPLLCTRVPLPPPGKKWGYTMNRQFTEATAQKANRSVRRYSASLQSGKCSTKARNDNISLYTQQMGKNSNV